MKLLFKTLNPSELYSEIINKIKKNELETWTIQEEDGKNYLKHTHQWGKKGVILITVDTPNAQLIAEVLKFKSTTEPVKDFEGYYLGRFCEIIFVNFPTRFQSINKG